VEQHYQGKLRRSIHLYINRCNSGYPPDKPLCSCVLFGEEDYLPDEEQKINGPPDGFRIVCLTDDGTDDDEAFEDSDNPSLDNSNGTDDDKDSKEDSD
jgi:hypothetical protein